MLPVSCFAILALILGCANGSVGASAFVSYAFDSAGPEAQQRLRFFLQHGLTKAANLHIDYGLTTVGGCRVMECKTPQKFMTNRHINIVMQQTDIIESGYFGPHSKMLQHIAMDSSRAYDSYILLDSSAAGPLFPAYMPPAWHWASAFVDKLASRVGLVSTFITCSLKDGPRVSPSALALSAFALRTLRDHDHTADNSIRDSIVSDRGHMLTGAMLRNKIGIDTLSLAYSGIDWLNSSMGGCRSNSNSLEENPYRGISVNPFETLFYAGPMKVRIGYMITDATKYMRWSDQRLLRRH